MLCYGGCHCSLLQVGGQFQVFGFFLLSISEHPLTVDELKKKRKKCGETEEVLSV